ncbi:DUF4349 domain-containing protein [Chitinimonas taiwanensis]|uniref:DUF4349 domain-containing protein n=1 Tax=Chitinimonas taiwanensis DSM 18899 TaxID=1121279 RepID=A0A1K2H602_9NEIS|nr:DUF4349 domain-containing protein [Chitinimonas taiwanensis]SFZ70994.1 protein of unknown function [Chitinimonas taiwanensis DSM 18899]
MRARAFLPLLVCSLLVACGQRDAGAESAAYAAAAPAADAPMAEAKLAEGGEQASRRYLAISHSLEVETPAEQVEPLWREVQQQALSMGADLISAELSRSDLQAPAASLSLRLPPAQVPALFALLAKGGELVNTRTDSEDKSAEVIDVEARLKNLSEARDRLRVLMNERGAKLADVLEVQKALTETQSQLDSWQEQRKLLAQQTEKVKIELRIHAPRSAIERSALAPLRDTWQQLGYQLAQSLAALLSFVVVVLPWMLLIVPAGLLIRRGWRKRRSAKM